ncbi:ThiF family adenylyltransferase [Pseudomonas viridiflava]|uniref:ThiF family adenylyltransferase n=1 Tax=Pseudomonas viridiflava TaxID=33069 RepID=UPI000F012CBE|nr:ThiF family adenylyltransferase [Pseudomonas viridiflava]
MEALAYDPVLKIKDSVDVYVSTGESDVCTIQFYHINTRQKLSIRIAPSFSDVLAALDGLSPLSKILKSFAFELDPVELKSIFEYLVAKGVLEHPTIEDPNSRYSRQINFLSDWIFGLSSNKAHEQIINSNVVIFGVGAVGSSIAINLARAGVSKFTFVDNKVLTSQSAERHPFFSAKEVGEAKVDALKSHLEKINSAVRVTCAREKLLPLTDLSSLVDDATLVVNTADEPYIGHTSVKLGRYLWGKKIPLYVAGGFDAHLMSTGDFYIPGESVCIDCCSGFFSAALADWKPTYKVHKTNSAKTHIIGGSGGTYSMSLFSASYACIQLLNYLAGGDAYKSRISQRGEFIIGKGEIEWVEILAKEGCNVCGK